MARINTARVASLLEIVLGILFIQGGIKVAFEQPVLLPGILTYFGTTVALYVYSVTWTATGAALLLAKYFQMKKTHKYSLLAMFITCVYVLILSVALDGVHAGQLVTILVGAVAAWLWLRWKLITEYIDPKEFQRIVDRHHEGW